MLEVLYLIKDCPSSDFFAIFLNRIIRWCMTIRTMQTLLKMKIHGYRIDTKINTIPILLLSAKVCEKILCMHMVFMYVNNTPWMSNANGVIFNDFVSASGSTQLSLTYSMAKKDKKIMLS